MAKSEQISLRDELLKMLDSDPFVPFNIVMSSGDRYKVIDPHTVAVGREIVIVIPPRGASCRLRFNHINALMEANGSR